MRENKKEALTKFHRTAILQAAEQLFLDKGIANTTMDDIAKAAEYSKATLYVYFKNKEEIVSSITLIGMQLLRDCIRKAVSENTDYSHKYFGICYAMVDFQKDHPFYFDNLLKEINVDLELKETLPVYHDIFDAGEEINRAIRTLMEVGVQQGCIRSDIKIPQMTFIFWASISGIIHMASQKENYITKCIGVSQEEFLQYSFETLRRSIMA